MKMKLNRLVWITTGLIAILILSVVGIRTARKENITPDLKIRDEYEIIISDAFESNSFRFMTYDGIVTDLFIAHIINSNSIYQLNTVMNLATWGPDGDLIATRSSISSDPSGVPVLLTSDGDFIECKGDKLPLAEGRVWITQNTTVISPDQREIPQRIILFDMETCQEIEEVYNSSDEKEVIEEATLSSQAWLAYSYYIKNESGGIKIINPSGNVYEIPNGMNPSWSKDGNYLAFTVHKEGLFYSDKFGRNIELITDNILYAIHTYPSWSPDGEWVIFSKGTNIFKFNVSSKEGELIFEGGINPNWRW